MVVDALLEKLGGLIDRRELEAVIHHAERAELEPGAILLKEGEASNSMYLIEAGEFEIVGRSDDGTEFAYAIVGAGSLVGEVGFIDGKPRTRTVRAQSRGIVWGIGSKNAETLPLPDRLAFYRLLSTVLAQRFRGLVNEAEPAKSDEIEELKDLHLTWTEEGARVRGVLDDIRPTIDRLKDGFYTLNRAPDSTLDVHDTVHDLLGTLDETFRVAGFTAIANHPESPRAQRDVLGIAGRYVSRELYSYLMSSHLAERIFSKPKGVAADYLTLDRIATNFTSGEVGIGTSIDRWFLSCPQMKAMRLRRHWMARNLGRECTRLFLSDCTGYQNIDILVLGAGPARELFDFVETCQFSDQLNISVVDGDTEALSFADQKACPPDQQATLRYVRGTPGAFIRDDSGTAYAPKDIIYSTTLADDLDDTELERLVARARSLLKPGGTLFLCNLSTSNPQRFLTNYVLDWPVRHRSIERVNVLVRRGFGPDADVRVKASTDGSDILVAARVL